MTKWEEGYSMGKAAAEQELITKLREWLLNYVNKGLFDNEIEQQINEEKMKNE